MRKFLQPLLIGELAPEEPSHDGPQDVSGGPGGGQAPSGGVCGRGGGHRQQQLRPHSPQGPLPGAKAGFAIPSWAGS